jgi:hypothetical protein
MLQALPMPLVVATNPVQVPFLDLGSDDDENRRVGREFEMKRPLKVNEEDTGGLIL